MNIDTLHTVKFNKNGTYQVVSHPKKEAKCTLSTEIDTMPGPPPQEGTWQTWTDGKARSWEMQ